LTFDGLKIPDVNGKPMSFEEWLEAVNLDGFIIVYASEKHGPIIATERYWHGMRPETLHLLWSASKSLSACLTAHALEKGELSYDTPVTDVLQEMSGTGLHGATIEDVFNMRSGTTPTYDPPEKNTLQEWGRSTHFYEPLPGETYPDGQTKFFIAHTKKNEHPHGEYFYYKAVDSWAVVLAGCRALGGDFPELFSELIWSRIGAEHNANVCVDQHGNSMTQLGISCTLRDFARWGIAHIDEESHRAIPRGFVERLSTLKPMPTGDDSDPSNNRPALENVRAKVGYCNLYWQYADPTISFTALGWHGQRCSIRPHERVVIAQFNTLRPDARCAPTDLAYRRIAEHVAEQYTLAGF
jgi:hypothetical protein